jgi:hypothetical protein
MANSTLHVPVSGLRWALVRRLLLAIPIGLFLGGILINAFGVGTAAAMIGGLVFSFAVFLGTIGLVGRRRPAVIEADRRAAAGRNGLRDREQRRRRTLGFRRWRLARCDETLAAVTPQVVAGVDRRRP